MEKAAITASKQFLVSKTHQIKSYIQDQIEFAEKLKFDPEIKQRIEKAECVWCFYSSRIGGQAMTTQACAACGEIQTYSSTNTDVFCKKCASKHDLCCHCGGDVNTRVRRKEWPTFDI